VKQVVPGQVLYLILFTDISFSNIRLGKATQEEPQLNIAQILRRISANVARFHNQINLNRIINSIVIKYTANVCDRSRGMHFKKIVS